VLLRRTLEAVHDFAARSCPPQLPTQADLAAEAQRAAQLAGRAFSMVGRLPCLPLGPPPPPLPKEKTKKTITATHTHRFLPLGLACVAQPAACILQLELAGAAPLLLLISSRPPSFRGPAAGDTGAGAAKHDRPHKKRRELARRQPAGARYRAQQLAQLDGGAAASTCLLRQRGCLSCRFACATPAAWPPFWEKKRPAPPLFPPGCTAPFQAAAAFRLTSKQLRCE
jgi:hypothetical protein